MAASRPRSLGFIIVQAFLLVLALALTVIAIVDLVTGTDSRSAWIGVVCWPIVALTSLLQLGRARS